MAVAVAPLVAVHSLAAAFGLSVLAGLALAPMISCQFSLVGALAPEGTVTEAFTWHRAATIAGMAGGSALGGSLIDARGASAAFVLGCVSVAAAAGLTVLGRRRIEPGAALAVAALAPAPLGPSGELPVEQPVALTPASEGAAPVAVEMLRALTPATEGPVPFTLAAEAVALAAEAVALAAEEPLSPGVGGPPSRAPFALAAEAVALAAEAVAQTAAA